MLMMFRSLADTAHAEPRLARAPPTTPLVVEKVPSARSTVTTEVLVKAVMKYVPWPEIFTQFPSIALVNPAPESVSAVVPTAERVLVNVTGLEVG
jgi:hypothetical protein